MACIRYRPFAKKWGVDYRDEDGKRRWITCESRAAAKQLLAEKTRDPGRDPRETFGAVAMRWLNITKALIRPQSWKHYEVHLRLHLLPRFGELKIAKITRSMLLEYLTGKMATLAPRTVYGLRTTLYSIFEFAVEYEGLSKNPVKGLSKKLKIKLKTTAGVSKAFTKEQLQKLLEAARAIGSAIYPLIMVMARAGLRTGEATALKWTDMDFKERTILVARTWVGTRLQAFPKTASSYRKVDMSLQLRDTLRKLQKEHKEKKLALGWRDMPDWVFTTSTGKPMRSYGRISALFKDVLRAARLPLHFSPHSLRHTFACLHLQAGANPAYIQKQLGHASIQMTVDLYGSWLPLRDLDAADRLDDISEQRSLW